MSTLSEQGCGETGGAFCGRWLFLDASQPEVRVGLFANGIFSDFRSRVGPALLTLPELVASVAEAEGCRPQAFDGVIHVRGPGSILGIRLAAMMIRAWKSLRPELLVRGFTWFDLAADVLASGADAIDLRIVAESRRGRWAVFDPENRDVAILDQTQLASLGKRCLCLPGRKSGQLVAEVGNVEALVLEPGVIAREIGRTPSWLVLQESADVWVAESTEYRKWEPGIHRSPGQK